mmetsp:Transcript_7055/g.20018  ORF Transcript_7055/g.20018 Transcript_7055/m.20018 type:complete len:453 (+) Transcript_7055:79-1437(+)
MTRTARTSATAAALVGAAALLGGEPCGAVVVLRRSRAGAELEDYSFERFVRDFGRDYAPSSQEFTRRAAVFEASLAQVRAVNARNAKEGRPWTAGVHPFMDWTAEERRALNGYKPAGGRGRRSALRGAVSLLHSGARAFVRGMANATWGWESFSTEALNTDEGGTPAGSGPAIRNQGNCGSCWAISAVEAVEAQLIRSGAGRARVAAQALVDCVPNPQHCGGSGGCEGATGELAYAFMRDYGIPLESEMPYHARTEQCAQAPLSGPWRAASSRVRVDGWTALPSNKAEPLMQALTQAGPVVVAVDGNNWFNYDSGVFDDCDKDAILGHAVLAKGYGKDGGNKYWLIQNSWGADWGEQGHIRLLRHDDEDSWCGTDNKPKEGVGCDGGPPEITVCGTCGILYDPIFPTGVRIEGAEAGAPAEAAQAAHASLVSQESFVDGEDALLDSMRAALQ